jgi:hypothetical protein
MIAVTYLPLFVTIQRFPLSLQAHCSAGELPWPFVNFDATILPSGTILLFL